MRFVLSVYSLYLIGCTVLPHAGLARAAAVLGLPGGHHTVEHLSVSPPFDCNSQHIRRREIHGKKLRAQLLCFCLLSRWAHCYDRCLAAGLAGVDSNESAV